MKDETIVKLGCSLVVAMFIGIVAFYVTVVWIILHFIFKFW